MLFFLKVPLAYLLNWVPGEIEDLEIGEVDEGSPLQRRQRVVREVQLQQGQRVVVLQCSSWSVIH